MVPPVEQSERRILGKYTLIAKLAKGGMGEICVARMRGVAGFEKLVVIKRVLPHLADSGEYIAMLQAEARIAARLSHQNICQVMELVHEGGEYYIVMEYLEGVVMSDLMRRMSGEGKRLDPRLVTAIIMQACKGLDAAHELTDRDGASLELVHRDISPSNLFTTSAGLVKLLDFGIARTPDRPNTTKTGAVRGKWAYMSPEQILREPLDRRSDIFSLGVVLYEGLTGQRLYKRPSEYETCRAITETDAPSVRDVRPDLPDELAAVVSGALSRAPEGRFATASEMSKALQRATASLGGPAGLSELAEFIQATFAAELDERRRFIESVEIKDEAALARDDLGPLPVAPNPFAQSTGPSRNRSASALREQSDEEPTEDTRSIMSSSPPSYVNPAPAPRLDTGSGSDTAEPRSGGMWKLWVAAAVVVAMVAGGAFVYVKSRPEAVPRVAQVIEERGRVMLEGEDAGQAAAAPVDARQAVDAAVDGAVGEPSEGPDEPEDEPDRGDRPSRGKSYSSEHYSQRLSARKARLTECFDLHVEEVDGDAQIRVELEIDKSGKVSEARLHPAKLAGTPLAGCLLRVVRSMRFGAHDEPVEVVIPLDVGSR